jgi:hypothetical protein
MPKPGASGLPRPEYPRPDRDRSARWLSLNGRWDFEPEWGDATSIVVPFAWETPASGVVQSWLEHAVYTRWITIPNWDESARIFLCFGAVNYRATVYLDDALLGEHVGGYTPFEYDITGLAQPSKPARLRVEVAAPANKADIPHGKQRSIPRDDYDGVCFTPSSGIWQPVWLEARGRTYVTGLRIDGSALDRFDIIGRLGGDQPAGTRVRITSPGLEGAAVSGPDGQFRVSLPVTTPHLWTASDPYLYVLDVRTGQADDADRLGAVAGLRRVEASLGKLWLNGERLYLRGVLDQGYWPSTGLTAPSTEALRQDIELAQRFGYNLVRKHIKLEDPLWLDWADRIGMLAWCEPPGPSRYSPASRATFLAQLPDWIERDANHPSIIIWGLYNEEWGLNWDISGSPEIAAAARQAYRELAVLDRTRPIVENSGWSHVETDLVDWHHYETDPGRWASRLADLAQGTTSGFPVNLGPDFTVNKSLRADGAAPSADLPLLNSEYGGGVGSLEQAWLLRWQTQELRRHDRFAGYVYTELVDVEHEPVGLADAWRQPKDLSGLQPAAVNAATVLVVDLVPQAPGADIPVPEAPLTLAVHISHHGAKSLDGTVLNAAWTPAGATLPTSQLDGPPADDLTLCGSSAVGIVHPYKLSDPVWLTVKAPGQPARLHLWLEQAGERLAQTFIDAGPTRQPGRPAILSG